MYLLRYLIGLFDPYFDWLWLKYFGFEYRNSHSNEIRSFTYCLFLCSVQHLASKKKGQGTTASFLTIATQLRVSVFFEVKSSDAFIYGGLRLTVMI